MKKTVLLLLAGSLASLSFGQGARLVFNSSAMGEAYITYATAPTTTTYLVIDNNAANAITELPAAGVGNIISEHENNRIRWRNNALSAVTYTVPFTTASGVKMPFSVTKTAAGAGPAGHDSLSFVFATFNHQVAALPPANQWRNNLYMPTGVTHMNDFFTGSVDNSQNAVDRFWIVDPQMTNYAYTTKPSISMVFNYDVADITAGNGGAGGITAATALGAQRFNGGVNKWGDMLPQGNNPAAGLVNNVVISAANFYRSWTLSSVSSPLPIELTAWKGECRGKEVELTWTTASETNNDFFTIEKSRDAYVWEVLAEVDAVGSSSSETNYSYRDENTDGLAYYRLTQTDNDHQSQVFDVIAAGCEADFTEIVNAWDDGINVHVMVSSTEAGVYDMYLTDASGKTMITRASQAINKNFTQLTFNKNGIARGMYTVTLQNAQNVMSRRLVLM